MDLKRLRQILDRAASKRILVIGDLMLDEFVWGKVGRISPEAPVPVDPSQLPPVPFEMTPMDRMKSPSPAARPERREADGGSPHTCVGNGRFIPGHAA